MNELRHSWQMSNRCRLQGAGHGAGLTDSMNKSEQETACSLFSQRECECAESEEEATAQLALSLAWDDVEGCRCKLRKRAKQEEETREG